MKRFAAKALIGLAAYLGSSTCQATEFILPVPADEIPAAPAAPAVSAPLEHEQVIPEADPGYLEAISLPEDGYHLVTESQGSCRTCAPAQCYAPVKCCGPVWYARYDHLFARYGKEGGTGLPTGAIPIRMGVEPAFRLTVGRNLGSHFYTEARWLEFTGSGVGPTSVQTATIRSFDGVIGYRMRMNCGVNARIESGIRHLGFHESFRSGFANASNSFSGTGMIIGAELNRALRPGLSGYARATFGSLLGDGRQSIFGTSANLESELVNVLEYGAGVQFSKPLGDQVVFTGRIGGEYVTYLGAGHDLTVFNPVTNNVGLASLVLGAGISY
ncbi:MAG: hypothetical protein R3C49_11355 [Planctomycetaceae bacterium]